MYSGELQNHWSSGLMNIHIYVYSPFVVALATSFMNQFHNNTTSILALTVL